jgi:CRP-like cAMP-binding protein
VKTNQDYIAFKNFILKGVELSNEEIEEVIEFTTLIDFKRHHQLIKKDEVCEKVYFILNGVVEYSIKNYKNDKMIFNFRFENSFVTAYSIYNNNIAKFDVTCIEDCKVMSIPIHAILDLLKKSYKSEIFKFEITQNHLLELVNYVTDTLSKTTLERYIDLESRFPNINQRIQQYFIANYLGVSQEHLSRLKKTRIYSNK